MSDMIEWMLELEVREGQAENVQSLLDEMGKATRANESVAPVQFTVYGPANEEVMGALARFGATDRKMVAGFHR